MEAKLEKICGISESRQRIAEYKSLLHEIMSCHSVEDLKTFTNHIVAERVPTVVSRQVLPEIPGGLFQAGFSNEQLKDFGTFALAKIKPRLSSFEETFSHIAESLATIYEGEEDWRGAAELLLEIPLMSGLRKLSDDYKAEKYIKIAQLFLECGDPVEAETYVNRATAIIHLCSNPGLKFQHQACRARILDSQRRFLDSARHYYELSQLDKSAVMAIERTDVVDERALEEQNMQALQHAVTCAILAPAGPQRSRVLAMLYKDERSASLDMWPILQKIYMERILWPPEVAKFTSQLDEHHQAMTSDGLTVVELAIIEHNLQAAASLYINITFEELGALLGIEPARAERVASKMLIEDRITGTIDQVFGVISFQRDVEEVTQWDTAIEGMCMSVNAIIGHIAVHHPTFVNESS